MSPTDLTDFGVDVGSEDKGSEPGPEPGRQEPARSYPNGRCPAINVGDRQRCRIPVSRMKAADGFCGTHGRERDPWTVHDDPETLILVTGRLDGLSLDDLDLIREAISAIDTGGEATG